MKDFGINVHEPWLLTWWPRAPHGDHRNLAKQYEREWENWLDANPKAKLEDLMLFTAKQAKEYQSHYYEGKYYFNMHQQVHSSGHYNRN